MAAPALASDQGAAGKASAIVVIIPTLDEEQSIADVVRSLPRAIVSRVIVADGGSRDATAQRASAAGGSVHLSWTAGGTSFQVERSTAGSGGPFKPIAVTGSTSFDDRSLIPGQAYTYRIVRLDAPGGVYSIGVALALVQLAHYSGATRRDGAVNAQLLIGLGFLGSAFFAGYIALLVHSHPGVKIRRTRFDDHDQGVCIRLVGAGEGKNYQKNCGEKMTGSFHSRSIAISYSLFTVFQLRIVPGTPVIRSSGCFHRLLPETPFGK